MKLLKKFFSQAEATAWVEANKRTVCPQYKRDDLTAEKVAQLNGVEFSPWLTKAFFNVCGSKGKGWGGKRPGSGKHKKDEA
jgi:hypothetical protein